MQIYIDPRGETRYIYNGVEYGGGGYGYGGVDPRSVSGEGGAGDMYQPTPVGAFPATNSYVNVNPNANAPQASAIPGVSAGPTVNPEAVQTRQVLGAEQDVKNPWDPMLVRRNAYDVGY